MEDSFSTVTSNSSNKYSANIHNNTYHHYKNKRTWPCNFTRFKFCYPYQPKLTNDEITKIKEINKNRTKSRQLKHWENKCQFYQRKIETANYYIEQEILKYYLQDQQNKENEKRLQIIKNQNPEAPKQNEHHLDLVDNNKPIFQIFNTLEIDGESNFAFRVILEALNINQIWHNTLRAIAANAIE